MQNRRTFLGIAAASLLPIPVPAQTSGPRPPAELARHALTGPLEGFEVVLLELNPGPGQGSPGPGHRHPGPVLGYVLEGQYGFAINHEPERVIAAGGTFFEATRELHTMGRSARPEGATRVLVFMLVPKGSPLTAPA
jgi:quercetin dioxygenase-like cupin family protein